MNQKFKEFESDILSSYMKLTEIPEQVVYEVD